MPWSDHSEDEEQHPSKSQRKREMHALRDLGERLLTVPENQLRTLSATDIVEAVLTCKKITKGNARKRQLQYIGKLMRSADVEEIQQLVDRLDASSSAHVAQFHRLEQWRDGLISEEPATMEAVLAAFPEINRQHLRQLVRNAIAERNEERAPPVYFRRLFQYLKEQQAAHPES